MYFGLEKRGLPPDEACNANEFRFSRNSSHQGCVLCRTNSEDWYPVLSVCPAYYDIRNLDGIFDFKQRFAKSDSIC